MSDEAMTVAEIANLIDWLKAHGHSEKEVVECLQYIADTKRKKTEKEAR